MKNLSKYPAFDMRQSMTFSLNQGWPTKISPWAAFGKTKK
jgi:hypothetical protein